MHTAEAVIEGLGDIYGSNFLKGVTIAAVGPATAEAARSHGLTPDIVSLEFKLKTN